ncbi:TonB-dependent receptor [Bacteroides xylanisolvens]|uniref:SusC/RagA family TonB-linked outer membrane protein n=1 Tax=Bacteroides xylanisolvens TaxID=371601 RepID=UPI00292A52FD|nr:TonB-dependent receptor [Bacteroides xylanisolvens]
MKRIPIFLISTLFMVFIVGTPALAFSPGLDEAQQNTVVGGVVVDKNNEPLIGVSVMVEGSSGGTITNMDGKFSISLPKNKTLLKFSYVGFATQTVSVKNKKEVRVVMHEDLQQLDEVVVVGYGVQQKSHLSGSVTKVNMDGIEDVPTPRLDQALLGKVAGVQILNTTSEVGADPDISIRGTSSFSASSNPLIIVDGFPVSDGLESLNPSDVESIEVLKDAASAAIYGSRAANGVIMITTKGGVISKPKYSVKAKWGVKSNYKLHSVLSTKEYLDLRIREHNLLGTSLSSQEMAYAAINNNTDWQQEAFNDNAYYYNVDFSVSGGSSGIRYYISGAYNSDEGMMLKNYYKRYNVKARIDADLSKRVTVGINIAPSYTESERPATNFTDFVRTPSWMPVKHTEETSAITGVPVGEYTRGSHFNGKTYTTIDPQTGLEKTVTATPWGSTNNNPRGIIDNVFSPKGQYRMQLQGYIDIKLLKELRFRSSNSFNFNFTETDTYQNVGAKSAGDSNRGYYTSSKSINLASENTLNYSKKFKGIHQLDGLLGASVYKYTNKRTGILGFDFPTDYIHYLSAAGRIDQYEGTTLRTGTWKNDNAMVSYFSRVNYALKDRYLLSVSLRTDGSSKFGKDNKWGWFPSVSAGWRISEESFIKERAKWLNQLKLRLSYGVTGTDAIESYANTDLLDSAGYILGEGNGSVVSGLANNSASLGNRALQWEQTNQANFGLDISLLNNRIGLTFDYYYSITKSLLYQKTVNSIAGYTQAWTNEGKLRNRGFEMELTTYNINNRQFKWSTSFNLSLTRNRLLDLGGPSEQVTPGSNKEYYIARVGDPLIQFYGFKTIGVWKSQEEIDNNPHHINDKPGGLRVANTNGDDVIDDNDRVPLGNPYPDFIWGMTNTLKYRDFDLAFTLQGQVGGKVYNTDNNYNEFRMWNTKYVANRWLSVEYPGDGKTPFRDNGIQHSLTDYQIEDAGFIALRDVTLGYDLPRKAARKVGLSKLRVYVSAQNLLYLWSDGYRGINPEARYASGVYRTAMARNALQRGAFPIQRTFSAGLNINF